MESEEGCSLLKNNPQVNMFLHESPLWSLYLYTKASCDSSPGATKQEHCLLSKEVSRNQCAKQTSDRSQHPFSPLLCEVLSEQLQLPDTRAHTIPGQEVWNGG